jgi:hypothetical protein
MEFKLKSFSYWRSVGQYGVRPPSSIHDQIFITVGHLRSSCYGATSWREDGSVIYLYNSLSFSGPSPAELMTTSYCLIWDYMIPFLSALTTGRATVGGILTRLHTTSPLNWSQIKFKVKVTLRLTVSQCVLVSSPFWLSWPDVCYCLKVTVLSLCTPVQCDLYPPSKIWLELRSSTTRNGRNSSSYMIEIWSVLSCFTTITCTVRIVWKKIGFVRFEVIMVAYMKNSYLLGYSCFVCWKPTVSEISSYSKLRAGFLIEILRPSRWASFSETSVNIPWATRRFIKKRRPVKFCFHFLR